MKLETYIDLQEASKLTNKQVAERLEKAEVTIEKWRSGRRVIPDVMDAHIYRLFLPIIKKNVIGIIRLLGVSEKDARVIKRIIDEG